MNCDNVRRRFPNAVVSYVAYNGPGQPGQTTNHLAGWHGNSTSLHVLNENEMLHMEIHTKDFHSETC